MSGFGFSEGKSKPGSTRYDAKNCEHAGAVVKEGKEFRGNANQPIMCEQCEKMRDKIRIFREHRRTKHKRNIIVINRSNKRYQALSLPKVMNLNPRSAMNKIEELKVFIDEENVDVSFISESHDRENKRLEDYFNLDGYKVISNLH